MDWSKLPPSLMQVLLPFQRDGVHFAVGKDGRCLIADEMGLGKTIQAISVACMYRDEWPLLVIVPSSLKFCWIEEFEKWLPDILPQEINLIRSGSDVSRIADSPISIVTYGLLRIPSAKLVKEAVHRCNFQVVICDESHYLKNNQTSSSKTIVPIIKMAKRRILLSGTPALARPVELYPQIDAVCPGRFGTFWQFTDRYCDPRIIYFGHMRQRKVDGASNLEELQKRLSAMLMIRREKSQVLKELPAKQRQRILFELKDSNMKKEILQKFDSLRQTIRKDNKSFQDLAQHASNVQCDKSMENNRETGRSQAQGSDDGFSVFRDISTLYRLSGEAKIGPVREYIEMLCENENLKFLVFAYHHAMMDGIEQSLYAKKVKFVRIDGHTKGIDRQTHVAQFQSDPMTRVAILSILAAGVGLTLTSAKLVVFAELYWTPGVMVQCEDRAHRIGQTNGLSVHYLVAKNTMDEWVWSSVCKKTIVTTTALSGKSQQLEHDEGHQYQIEVLSKADAWKPQEKVTDVDVAELIKSQRQPDQSSILDFFPSPRQQQNGIKMYETENKSCTSIANSAMHDRHRKEIVEKKKSVFGSHLKRSKHLRFTSPAAKIKTANKNLSECLIVVDSDEEEEFKPVRKKIKRRKHFSKEVEVMKDDHDINERYKEPSDLKVEENLKVLSGSDDLFSDESSDSLPDVYLGPRQEKAKPEIENESDTLDKTEKPNGLLDAARECQAQDDDLRKSEDNVHTVSRKRKLSPVVDCEEQNVPADERLKPMFGFELNFIPKVAGEQNYIDFVQQSSPITEKTLVQKSYHSESIPGISPKQDCIDPKSLSSTRVERCENHCQSKPKIGIGPETPETPCKEKESILDKRKTKQWQCVVCTFLNHQDLGLCEICDSPKKQTTQCDTPMKQMTQCEQFPSTAESLNNSLEDKSSCPLQSSSSQTSLNASTNSALNCSVKDSELIVKPNSSLCASNSISASITSVTQCLDRAEDKNTKLETDIEHNESFVDPEIEVNEGKSLVSVESNLKCNIDFIKDDKETRTDCEEFPYDEDFEMLGGFSTLSDQFVGNNSITPSKISEQRLSLTHSKLSSNGSSLSSPSSSTCSTSNKTCREVLTSPSASSSLPSSSTTETFETTSQLACIPSSSSPDSSIVYKTLKFSCSINTGRIYVYDEKDRSLKVNFQPVEVEMGNTNGLPIILKQPQHLRLLQRFVREWMGLSATKRRVIAKQGLVFERPMQAYDAVRSVHGSTQRHLIKESLAKASEKAQSIQGRVRLIRHGHEGVAEMGDVDNCSSGQGTAQVVTHDGVPLCLQCEKPYSNPLLPSSVVSKPENAWLLRLCSHSCMDKYWTLKHASYCRDQIYEIERGVCRMCHFNAQGFYNQMKSTKDVRQRAEMVNKSHYAKLGSKAREKLVTQVFQGQFWHVDHITPVWKGGGMCDLDNLRTLCTPCHMKITKEQAGQRANVKKLSTAVSGGDITAFFKKS